MRRAVLRGTSRVYVLVLFIDYSWALLARLSPYQITEEYNLDFMDLNLPEQIFEGKNIGAEQAPDAPYRYDDESNVRICGTDADVEEGNTIFTTATPPDLTMSTEK